MRLGLSLPYDGRLEENFSACMENRIPTCQLSIPTHQYTKETLERIKKAQRDTGMEITALIGTWDGPNEWNFTAGPQTLGIVPIAYRNMRMQQLLDCARFAAELGVSDVCTHMGFIPENPSDQAYPDFLAAVSWLAGSFARLGIHLNFETGQETPVTLLRTMQALKSENVGINFDPANLLMYGKGNPIDAVGIIGPYIRGVHAKDGEYPVDGYHLGQEKVLGEGSVNIPLLIQALKQQGYCGTVTIEREISGPQQWQDVLTARDLLESLL